MHKTEKPRIDLVPPLAIRAIAWAMTHGVKEHGERKWRGAGTDPGTRLASLLRHLNEYQIDPNATEENSGLPVLWHALAQLAIMVDLVEDPPETGEDQRRIEAEKIRKIREAIKEQNRFRKLRFR